MDEGDNQGGSNRSYSEILKRKNRLTTSDGGIETKRDEYSSNNGNAAKATTTVHKVAYDSGTLVTQCFNNERGISLQLKTDEKNNKMCKAMQQSPFPLEREILACVSKIEGLRLISVEECSKEKQQFSVTIHLALVGKDGTTHDFLVVKKYGTSDDDDRKNVITTDETGHSYVLSTDDKFLLDNLYMENCQEGLKDGGVNLKDVLDHLTDVYNNVVLEIGRVESAEEEYEYEDDSEIPMIAYIARPFSSKFEPLPARAGPGTTNRTITEDGIGHKGKDEMLWSPNPKRPGVSSSCVTGNTRLMKDLLLLMKTDTTVFGFSIDPINDSNISLWNIHLFNFEDCELAADMGKMENERGVKTIELQLNFPNDYPYSPPQARIIQPRFKPGGFIHKGGFCIDLLTKEGWSPSYGIESLVVQLRSMFISGGARIDFFSPSTRAPYSKVEASHGFQSAAKSHNWRI